MKYSQEKALRAPLAIHIPIWQRMLCTHQGMAGHGACPLHHIIPSIKQLQCTAVTLRAQRPLGTAHPLHARGSRSQPSTTSPRWHPRAVLGRCFQGTLVYVRFDSCLFVDSLEKQILNPLKLTERNTFTGQLPRPQQLLLHKASPGRRADAPASSCKAPVKRCHQMVPSRS